MTENRMAADGAGGGGDADTVKRLHGYTEIEVTRKLILAIFEQRLPPGQRITEAQLSEAFNVSRTVVRQSISKLSEIGVFTKTPNQGCTIASPSRDEARKMLQLRIMVEPAMVRGIAATRSAADVGLLRDHIALENDARSRQDRSTLVRLTGEFHLKLAEMSANPYLIRLMTELQVLTCLAILVHAEAETCCPRDEHSTIVEAIARGDGDAAHDEMLHHLKHITEELNLDRDEPEPNLRNAFMWLRGAISA
ncbi:GntR family transcriptional regulator [Allorhizobium sp. NPDC080224]|uniref:GntR family transcriptional regulator n=1 Tax=Allorhizobium sp. NPDC080224 TaxID=3390547 RepID=UPI0017ED4EC1|nr:GntR family transcriptional regulator [Hyphomicrobiales bacterium]